MTDKAEEARREALVNLLMKGAPSSLSRDKARFMVDLGAKAWEDASANIARLSEMLEPEHRAAMSIVAAKSIQGGVEAFLDYAEKNALDRLTRMGATEGCDCTVCQLARAAEQDGLAGHPLVEALKAAGFDLVDQGDGYAVLRGRGPNEKDTLQ